MKSALGRPSMIDRARLYAKTGRRAVHRYGVHPSGLFGPLDPRPVFIVGCPRSGTTFTASALGAVTGFADLGEVSRLKAAIPELYGAAQDGRAEVVTNELRTIVSRSQRAAMAARRRGIEQTPESTYLIPELARAFPRAHFIHLLRDGRDVVASLIERGWLAGDAGNLVTARAGGEAMDDAGHPFGGYARFWVEPGRELEFEQASEPRRCAWAWRRYVTAARTALAELPADRVTTIRYESLTADPEKVARQLSAELGAPASAAELAHALGSAHPRSVGKFTARIGADCLDEVLAEIAALLANLGYRKADSA